MQSRPFRLGTRGSPLALAQSREVRNRLIASHRLDEEDVEICTLSTSGDQILDKALREVGGKGLFTKEIEEALLAGEVDAAIHSMKDMETTLPEGLTIGAVLPREDVRDAFLSLSVASFEALPEGAVVGTSSLRRQAQVKQLRPDLEIVEFRGNVQTRLKKLADGVADATFLACAGLNRLGLSDKITQVMDTDQMLPAVAQGAIGVQIRQGDDNAKALCAPLNDAASALCVRVERAFLSALDGSCRTPIAGLAEMHNDDFLTFRGTVIAPDGRDSRDVSLSGAAHEIEAQAGRCGAALLSEIDRSFFEVSS